MLVGSLWTGYSKAGDFQPLFSGSPARKLMRVAADLGHTLCSHGPGLSIVLHDLTVCLRALSVLHLLTYFSCILTKERLVLIDDPVLPPRAQDDACGSPHADFVLMPTV